MTYRLHPDSHGFLIGLAIGVVLSIMMVVAMIKVAHGQELDRIVTACVEQPKVTEKQPIWAWRTVDGKRCWYPGEKWRERSLLYWKDPIPDPEKPMPVPDPRKPDPEPDRLIIDPPPPMRVGESMPFPIERWWPLPLARW